MASYTHIYRNPAYPKSIVPMSDYKNIDENIKQYVVDYKKALQNGDLTKANNVLLNASMHGIEIKKYMLNADTINSMQEEIRNTQIYALRGQQIHITKIGESEPEMIDQDIWLQEY